MSDDGRLDAKLAELARELMLRPLVPGFSIADAFTMRGVDELGKPGMFAAVLLSAEPPAELDTLTRFRQALTARLKQIHTGIAGWPIVVQGAPELIDGQSVVPGGREYFLQLKEELHLRRERVRSTPLPVLLPVADDSPPPKRRSATGKKVVRGRAAGAARSARTARARR